MEKEEIKEAIKEYLKENLLIAIDKDSYYNSVEVKLMLGEEELSSDTIYLPSNDSEENW